jgi:hypothetical protein
MDLEASDAAAADDTVPGADTVEEWDPQAAERKQLRALATAAEALRGDGDPKLLGAVTIARELVREAYHPVIFCRYIATANYLADELAKRLPETTVLAVTGELPQEERLARVLALGAHPRRVLVATDCLSEGINLQQYFDAVVHYDLAWNPTRHEQREGRVDRFGQVRTEVRTVLLYGADNGVDGIILKVLLQKAESIRKSLGVSVPLPLDSTRVLEAIFEAMLLRGGADPRQLAFDFDMADARLQQVDLAWKDAEERERQSITKYRQAGMRPEDVARELRETAEALGDHTSVQRFVEAAASRLGATLEPLGDRWRLHLDSTPLLQSVAAESGVPERIDITFKLPAPSAAMHIARTHPLVEVLAARIAGTTLDSGGTGVAARCGAIRTRAVTTRTTLLVLRLRFHLTIAQRGESTPLLAEECLLAAFEGQPEEARWLSLETAQALLQAEPAANVPQGQRTMWLQQTIDNLAGLQEGIAALARERADALRAAHERVRDAARMRGIRYSAEPLLPADVLGLYVLMPAG